LPAYQALAHYVLQDDKAEQAIDFDGELDATAKEIQQETP